MCDASGAVEIDDRHFAVADDEDNLLRVYDSERGGAPLAAVNLSPQLDLPKKDPESDLEAATRLGGEAYWLTSHGRSSKGKPKPERLFFFATTVPNLAGGTSLLGRPHRTLLHELAADPRFSPFGLGAAAELAPKAPGGLNLEGMTATPEGALVVGFRNPVPGGKALLFRIENPRDVVGGAPPRFSEPIRLDLGGLGVRSLSYWRGRYLIVAGGIASEAASRLFTWDGKGPAIPAAGGDLHGSNPEAFFTPDARDEILLLSDDGALTIEGAECKALKKTPEKKRFRGLWIRPEPGRVSAPTAAPSASAAR
jgi:hypothetical protein